VDAETLCRLGEALGYRVELSWARCDASGRFDVLFQRDREGAATWPAEPRPPLLPWARYANRPLLKTPGQEGLVPALRAHLRESLPDLTIPTAFVFLEALPRAPDGGLDLQALPPLDEHALVGEAFPATPRTPVEQTLARLWQQLLRIDAVGLEDNFFELGGHSLLAVKLFAEIERTFGRRLPLSTLYQAPSLGRLADAIAQASDRSSSAVAVLQPRGSRPPLFLVHGLQGDVLEYRGLVNSLGPDQPVFGLEGRSGDDSEALLQTVEQLASGYVEELRRQQPTGPYYLCGYCWAGALTFEIGQQLRRAGEEVALLALIDAACPGHRGPRPPGNRLSRRRRNFSARIARNLGRLGELRMATVPRFLWDRAVRMATELLGASAFRWSVRLRRPLFPAFRGRRQAFMYAARAYRPATYPGRLTLLRAWTSSSREQGALWGWDRVAAGGVELHRVPGDHDEVMREPKVAGLAAALRASMDRTSSDLPEAGP
jgi:thioesterase domain-containing protein/acyl carrier protein